MPDEQQQGKQPGILVHTRDIPIGSVNLSDPDEDGARLLELGSMSTPDKFIFVIPGDMANYLQERFNGGLVVPKGVLIDDA